MNTISTFSFEYDKSVQSLRAELLTQTAKRHLSRLGGVDNETIKNPTVDLDSFLFERSAGTKQSARTHVLVGMPSNGKHLSKRSILIAVQPIISQVMQSEANWATSSQSPANAVESLLSKLEQVVFLDDQANDASIGLSHFAPFQLVEPFPVYLAPQYDAPSVKALVMDYDTDADDVSQYLPDTLEVHRLSDVSTHQEMLDLIQSCQIHIHLDYREGMAIDVISPLDSLFSGFFTIVAPTRSDTRYTPGNPVTQASAERSYATILKTPDMMEQTCVDFKNRLQLTSQIATNTPPEILSAKMKNEVVFQQARHKLEKVLFEK